MIEAGALVIVSCHAPKEKLWGVVVRLDALGLVLRGLDLGSVEDWLVQERNRDDRLIGPSTVFLPMHRIERLYLDESSGPIKSFADRYRSACGREATEVLLDPGNAPIASSEDEQEAVP